MADADGGEQHAERAKDKFHAASVGDGGEAARWYGGVKRADKPDGIGS